MTILATRPPGEHDLAPFDTSLQLGDSEPLGDGVKRVTMEQIERAASVFLDLGIGLGGAVHDSRRSIKKVRALLRLVKGELPQRIFEFENKSMRDTGRLLSEIRSAQGILNAAETIQGLYSDLLAPGTFAGMVERLARRRDHIERSLEEEPTELRRVVRGLERAYHRYASWPTDPEARQVYGLGIRDSYEAIRPGLGITYDDGRRSMVQAYERGDPGDFHEWRKRVKDLRHQMEFLAPLWPEVVVGTAMTLERLGDLLGEDNDLAELLSLLRDRPEICADPRERSLFRALALQRRNELQMASEILGRRIYAEQPKSVVSRFGEYWGSRQMVINGKLDTIVVY